MPPNPPAEDVVSLLIADHRAVERMFREFEAGQIDAADRPRFAEQLITELVRHAIGEEEYVYPEIRDVVPGGDHIADHELADHAELEDLLRQLTNVRSDHPEFDQLVRTITRHVRRHVDEEESDTLPRLTAVSEPQRLIDLGAMFFRAKDSAPTRPHPGAPHRPPANLVTDPALGLVDRLRDTFTGRRTR